MEISQILTDALSGNLQVRKQAEDNIESLAFHNFGGFLLECARELALETRQTPIRQMASTLIKNLIHHSPNHIGKWTELDKTLKDEIKNTVLSCLASSNKDVRKAAATSVAAICKLEIPAREWNEIIEILFNTSQNEDRNIKISSIITLNYISQELTPKDLLENDINTILNVYYLLLSNETDEEVVEITVKAFGDFVTYLKNSFQNEEYKNLLLTLIYRLSSHSLEKIRFLSVQILLEIVRIYYDVLESNIDDLLKITMLRFEDTESIAILTYEIWCSICDTEIARSAYNSPLKSRNYANRAYRELLKAILTHIILISSDEDKWSYSKASCCLLSLLSQCCEVDLLNQVYIFISTNISNDNMIYKEASLLAFGAILETKDKESLTSNVIKSVDVILEFLCSNNSIPSLRDTSAWVIERICELYGEEFIDHAQTLYKLYETIVGLLTVSKRKIVKYLLNSLHFLYRGLRPLDGQVSNVLSKYVKDTLDLLLKLGFDKSSYDSENNVATSVFFAISSIIEYSAPDTKNIINEFFEQSIEAFKLTFDETQFTCISMRNDYQGYISVIIQSALISHVTINSAKAKDILGLVVESFNIRKGIYEEGLMLCSAIALNIGQEFDIFMNDFIKYLIYALNSYNEISLCTTSIHVTSDLIRALYNEFGKYVDQLLPPILNILGDHTVNKSFKPHCLNVISDYLINCTVSENFKYFEQIMNLLGNALEAATYREMSDDDWESAEYFDELREHLVECLTCVFHSIKGLKKELEFESYVVPILQFLFKINEKDYITSQKVTNNCLGLIGDFCESYKGKLKNHLNLAMIEEMIRKVRGTKIKNVNKTIICIEKLVRNEMNL